MATRLLSSMAQYLGSSSDVKPYVGGAQPDGTVLTKADLTAGATFLEADTGISWRYDGTNWQRVPTDGVQVVLMLGVLNESIQALHRTLEMTRQGLVNQGNADDVNPADVAGTPAELAF